MDGSRKDDTADEAQNDSDLTERRKEFTRRALVRAGWVVPFITAVNIPSAYAQSPAPPHADHADHTDVPHSDVPHTDTPHTDHADAPHQDHQDHADTHVDTHTDVPHTDVPHADT